MLRTQRFAQMMVVVVAVSLTACSLDFGELIDEEGLANEVNNYVDYYVETHYVGECGDGLCDIDGGESPWCEDCQGAAYYLDDYCEPGEADWSPDCAESRVCGNGLCHHDEWGVCPQDCPIVCGDGTCTPNEMVMNYCAADCDLRMCGDRFCSVEFEENRWCPSDCQQSVTGDGNGVCEIGEYLETVDGDFVAISHDCDDGFCGDDDCTESEEGWCELDCELCADDETRPLNCGDGCFDEWSDCTTQLFECGGDNFHCTRSEHYGNCCGDKFRQCAEWAPYYCPATNGCVADLSDCVIDHERECPPWKAHFCELDGACYETAEECSIDNTVCVYRGQSCEE